MSLSRVIPAADLVHPGWFDLLPEPLRPRQAPTQLWWRLHEGALARAWSVPALDEPVFCAPWRALGASPAERLADLVRSLSLATWPDAGASPDTDSRPARVLDHDAVRALEREAGPHAAPLYLLLCAAAASRACLGVLQLRFDPLLGRQLLPRCEAIFSPADLRLGARMAAVILAGFGAQGLPLTRAHGATT